MAEGDGAEVERRRPEAARRRAEIESMLMTSFRATKLTMLKKAGGGGEMLPLSNGTVKPSKSVWRESILKASFSCNLRGKRRVSVWYFVLDLVVEFQQKQLSTKGTLCFFYKLILEQL